MQSHPIAHLFFQTSHEAGSLRWSSEFATSNVLALSDMPEEDLLRLAALAEQGSEHPLAAAIVEGARARGLPLHGYPEQVTALAGRGLQATVEGYDVLIGTRNLLREHAIALSGVEEQLAHLETRGKAAMLIAVDGAVNAIIREADPHIWGTRLD
jgi:Cu+-exporting ATPase